MIFAIFVADSPWIKCSYLSDVFFQPLLTLPRLIFKILLTFAFHILSNLTNYDLLISFFGSVVCDSHHKTKIFVLNFTLFARFILLSSFHILNHAFSVAIASYVHQFPSNMNVSKTPGKDGFPLVILKCLPDLTSLLCHLLLPSENQNILHGITQSLFLSWNMNTHLTPTIIVQSPSFSYFWNRHLRPVGPVSWTWFAE